MAFPTTAGSLAAWTDQNANIPGTGTKANATNLNLLITEVNAITNTLGASALALSNLAEDPATTTALIWGYQAGRVVEDNVVRTIAAGTVNLTNNATNYIEFDATNDTMYCQQSGAFTTGRKPVAKVITSGGFITQTVALRDQRTWLMVYAGAPVFAGSNYTITGTWTWGAHLLFTDNTYDIGASGATRPRTGYFGTSVVSPVLTAATSLTTPTIYGGSAAGSTLSLVSTSGTGSNDAVHIKGGTNGGTTIASFFGAGTYAGNVGIGTTGPASLTEIQGGLTTVGAVLTLGSKETSTVVNDVLGRINFYAPLDAAGTDANLVAGSIAAVAEGSFSATSNATSLIFQTGASEVATTKMTIASTGLVTIASGLTVTSGNITASAGYIDVAGSATTGVSYASSAHGFIATSGAAASQAGYYIRKASVEKWAIFVGANVDTLSFNGVTGIAATLTSAGVFTAAGGLTVTAGGATITAGNLGVGTAAAAGQLLDVRGTTTTSAEQHGFYLAPTFNASATDVGSGISINPTFTGSPTNGYCLHIPVAGGAGTPGTLYGIRIEAQTKGTANVGLYNGGTTTLTDRLTATTITATLDTASTGTALILDGSNIIRPLTSAERYKENIRRDWQTDTEAFFALSPILFDYKNGGARDVLSFSADQSMSLPHLVNLNGDGLPESLREHAFIAYLFNSAKADHARIAELERKLKLLLEVSKCEDS